MGTGKGTLAAVLKVRNVVNGCWLKANSQHSWHCVSLFSWSQSKAFENFSLFLHLSTTSCTGARIFGIRRRQSMEQPPNDPPTWHFGRAKTNTQLFDANRGKKIVFISKHGNIHSQRELFYNSGMTSPLNHNNALSYVESASSLSQNIISYVHMTHHLFQLPLKKFLFSQKLLCFSMWLL